LAAAVLTLCFWFLANSSKQIDPSYLAFVTSLVDT